MRDRISLAWMFTWITQGDTCYCLGISHMTLTERVSKQLPKLSWGVLMSDCRCKLRHDQNGWLLIEQSCKPAGA